MKKTILLAFTVIFFALPAYGAYPTTGSTQSAYCHVPPYLSSNVKPNINLVLDFSGSMQFPAYLDCSKFYSYDWGTNVASCGTYSPLSSQYMYNAVMTYYGNFNSNMYYKYNSSGYFEENAGCTTAGKFSTGCVPGNLLNWISTTRTDVLRKILTGGRIAASEMPDVIGTEGARYIVTDTNLHCTFTVTAASGTNRKLTVENQGGQTCDIGTGSNYNMNVKTSTPITGIVQSIYPSQTDLELSVFHSDIGVAYRTGKNKLVTDYVSAINSEQPYYGTPTGEALEQAMFYFQQSNSMSAIGKSNIIGKTDYLKDPYYETTTTNLIPAPCRSSYVLLISDGAWNGSSDPVIFANAMHTIDMRTDTAMTGNQNVSTYTVYAFGDLVDKGGRNSMITTALFGGYDDKDKNGMPYPFSTVPTNSLKVAYPLPECNPGGTWNPGCEEWGTKKTGLPYNFFEANEGSLLQQEITKAVGSILAQASSGTAASMLGNSDSSGSVMLQTLFFPERSFADSTKARWLGDIQAFWYYVDPSLNSSRLTLREDTVSDNKLKSNEDRIASFVFNNTGTDAKLKVRLFDDKDGNGVADSPSVYEEKNIDEVKALWRAGLTLWSRLPDGTKGRIVYTNDLNPTPMASKLMKFSVENVSLLKSKLDVDNSDLDSVNVIKYILGRDPGNDKLKDPEKSTDLSGYRSRTVKIGDDTHVWKLGDIINSTPRMISPVPLNTYSSTPPGGYRDKSYDRFVSTLGYKNRGAAFVGGNDGMLHAFKMGKTVPGSQGYVSRLVDSSDLNGTNPKEPTELGNELWSYIPINVLPYLKHLGNPSYKHLYYVDSTPTIFDASIGMVDGVCANDPLRGCSTNTDCVPSSATCNSVTPACGGADCPKVDTSWRTVLIGSMGLGGATRNNNIPACGSSSLNCVATPVTDLGYSSYFALDVTDQTSPKLLWEFSDPGLGFSTVGPAIIRIRDASDKSNGTSDKNGKYFVILASGPTGPISGNQMKGYSDQPLNIYVLDLRTGKPVRTFSNNRYSVYPYLIPGTPHTNIDSMPGYAFGGAFSNATIDTDKRDPARTGNYSDDAIYLGYVKKDVTGTGTYTKGGVLRLLTGDSPDPANWTISTVIDDIGPVTSAVAKLQSTYAKKLWLFFGTGRFFYKYGSTIDEDYTDQHEAIYGIMEPCYSMDNTAARLNDLDPACKTTVAATALQDQTNTVGALTDKKGWKIDLGTASGTFKAKRIYTNPTTTSNGVVFFTAFRPSTAACGYGGDTSIWAVNYSNGASVSSRNLKGQAVLQLATGEIKQIDLATEFKNSGNRESGFFTGPPSKTETRFVSNGDHTPSKKVLHIMER